MNADLLADAEKWLHLCGSCDAGLTMSCTCPPGDPRAIIQRLHEALTGRLVAQPARTYCACRMPGCSDPNPQETP